MPVYQYRAADRSGKVVEGLLEAEAERRVVSRLHEMGLTPLRIALPGEAPRRVLQLSFGSLFKKKVSERDLLHFTQELNTLLAAGLPLDRSLALLSGLVEGEGFQGAVRLLLEGVRAGKSLASTMADQTEIFPKLYANMIRAGEVGGVLENVLGYLSDYLERSLEFKEELKAALTYPLVLGGVAGFSLIVLFVYVIPKFAVIFRDVGEGLPWLTGVVIAFSTF